MDHAARKEGCGAAQRPSAMRVYFEGLENSVLAQRGRILFEPHAPYFINSCDGSAARILDTSCSRLWGRRLRAICVAQNGSDIAKLERACRASCDPHTRSYLSITTAKGRQVPMIVQVHGQSSSGRLQLEALLFPAPECHPDLVQCLHTEDLSHLHQKLAHAHPSGGGRDSPDKDIGLDTEGVDDSNNDALAGLADDLLTGIGQRMREVTLQDGAAGKFKQDLVTSVYRDSH